MEDLYQHVPPTKIRNKNEKFAPAKTSPFWLFIADTVFFRMMENRFFAFRYKNADKVFHRDTSVPTILSPANSPRACSHGEAVTTTTASPTATA